MLCPHHPPADMQFLESEFDKLGREPQSLRDKLKELQIAFEDERKNAFGGFLGKGISSTIAVPDDQYVERCCCVLDLSKEGLSSNPHPVADVVGIVGAR